MSAIGTKGTSCFAAVTSVLDVCTGNCALSQRAKEIQDQGSQNRNDDAKKGAGNRTYIGNRNEHREEIEGYAA